MKFDSLVENKWRQMLPLLLLGSSLNGGVGDFRTANPVKMIPVVYLLGWPGVCRTNAMFDPDPLPKPPDQLSGWFVLTTLVNSRCSVGQMLQIATKRPNICSRGKKDEYMTCFQGYG